MLPVQYLTLFLIWLSRMLQNVPFTLNGPKNSGQLFLYNDRWKSSLHVNVLFILLRVIFLVDNTIGLSITNLRYFLITQGPNIEFHYVGRS